MKIVMILFAMMAYATTPNTTSSPKAETPGGAYLKINGKFGGEIYQTELAQDITLEIDGCAKGAKIYQFTLVIDHAGKTTEYMGDSNELTKDMLAEIKALKKGDSFKFERVKARLGKDDKFDVVARPFTIA